MRARKKRSRHNKFNTWALIYDQCSPELKNNLEGAKGYDKVKENNNIVQLLKMICMALVKVIKKYQGSGSITNFPNMIKNVLNLKNPGIDMSKATPDQMKEAKKTVHNKVLAALLQIYVINNWE
jgi:hypothetical protein